VKKRSAEVIAEKSRTIKKLQADVKDMEELASDVALEHHETTKEAASSTKQAEKKIASLHAAARWLSCM
jgi:uncharacterized protein YoxC